MGERGREGRIEVPRGQREEGVRGKYCELSPFHSFVCEISRGKNMTVVCELIACRTSEPHGTTLDLDMRFHCLPRVFPPLGVHRSLAQIGAVPHQAKASLESQNPVPCGVPWDQPTTSDHSPSQPPDRLPGPPCIVLLHALFLAWMLFLSAPPLSSPST